MLSQRLCPGRVLLEEIREGFSEQVALGLAVKRECIFPDGKRVGQVRPHREEDQQVRQPSSGLGVQGPEWSCQGGTWWSVLGDASSVDPDGPSQRVL